MLLLNQTTLTTTSALLEKEELDIIIAGIANFVENTEQANIAKELEEFVNETPFEEFVNETLYVEINTQVIYLDIEFDLSNGKVTISVVL